MKRGKTSVYVCGFGCDTPLTHDGPRYLTGDPMLPTRVCGPGCPDRPKLTTVFTRESIDAALAAAV